MNAQEVDHDVEALVVHLEPGIPRHRVEDTAEVGAIGRLGRQLVGNAAQEGRVHQVGRRQVGGEDHELVEGNLEALAGVQLEKVDAALQGHDPAVEQVRRGHELAPEIVDDEGAVEALHVQRRLVELGRLVVLQVEHFEGELATGHDDRPLAGHPAQVDVLAPEGRQAVGAFVLLHRLVDAVVVDLDDLALHLHRIGDVDDVVEDRGDALGDRGLAVAGGTVEQQGAARVHRRADELHELVGDDEAGELTLQIGAVEALVGHPLAENAMGIGLQRYRRRAGILVLVERVLAVGAPGAGEREARAAEAAGGAGGGGQGLEELALLGGFEQRVDHREGELDGLGDLRRRFEVLGEHGLDHEAQQIGLVDVGFLDAARRRRRVVHGAVELLLAQRAERHKIVAEAPAAVLLALYRLIDLLRAHQALGNENISQQHLRSPRVTTLPAPPAHVSAIHRPGLPRRRQKNGGPAGPPSVCGMTVWR